MTSKNCKICNLEYIGRINSSICSEQCKKRAKCVVNDKYNSKIKENKEKKIWNDNLEGEIWKSIKNYENIYEISNLGRVRGKIRRGGGGFLKQYLTKEGYYRVCLRDKNISDKCIKFLTHRLIADHFIENPNNLPIVDHVDRNRQNNNLNNLRWVSHQGNCLNSSRVIDRKGCISHSIENVNEKKYEYYRVYKYINNVRVSKRFKNKEDAILFFES